MFLSASTNAICRHGGGRVGELGVGESSERFFSMDTELPLCPNLGGKGLLFPQKWEG